MDNTEALFRRLRRLQGGRSIDPPRLGAAVFAAAEGGPLPADPALATEAKHFLDALAAIEAVQQGIADDEESSSGDDVSCSNK